LWQAYIGRRVACHVHFVFCGSGEHEPKNLCADFQVFPHSGEVHAERVELTAFQFRALQREGHGGDKYWAEHPVFVPVGELSDDCQPLKFRVARSVVGLGHIEDCPVAWRNFAKGIRAGERLAVVLNREFDKGFLFDESRSPGVVDNELPSELVKGTSETVHDVTQYHGDTHLPVTRQGADLKDVIARIRVEIGPQLNLVALPVENGVNLAFESIAVLIRPLNLGSRAAKVNSHD
jgi:hypothetical protein